MRVRSRSGSLVLTVVGAVYTVGALAALVIFAIDVWKAAGIIDYALQVGLIIAGACGVWFLLTGLASLGVGASKNVSAHGRPDRTHGRRSGGFRPASS